tara:strand:- start:103 stop:813 length:711 start_codon:yes stop_codon:yes gene_type:complete
MAIINLDLSRKVDINCRANDNFDLHIGATDEEGNALNIAEDQHFYMTIYDSQKEPVMIFSSIRTVNQEKDAVIYNFSYSITEENILLYQKRAYALQKLINSNRIIAATAYNDSYHPLLVIAPDNEVNNRGSLETSEKLFFTELIKFTRSTVTDPTNQYNVSIPAITYDPDKKKFIINVDAASFNLPPNRYLYDLKTASQLFCPWGFINNFAHYFVEQSVYESSTTLIHGSITVKKD